MNEEEDRREPASEALPRDKKRELLAEAKWIRQSNRRIIAELRWRRVMQDLD